MRRDDFIAQLGHQSFDLLIIGGGIVGAGIARDAAMRGLRVALIEQGDFGSGASSKTSKLIHGGLRYLEHGHLSLVTESLRERQTLRRIAPDLVRSLELLLPCYRGDTRSPWKVHAGLLLYGLMARGDALRVSQMVPAGRVGTLEPRLRQAGLRAAGRYADCQMDDARLCLANILAAIEAGAVCGNYVRLQALMTSSDRVCGGIAQDLLTSQAHEIRAKVVVNAAGPWADRVRRLSDATLPARLSPTKGIHLVLPHLTTDGVFVQARADRRMLFILPWEGATLVGTTESAVDGPLEALCAGRDEVGYLLREVNRVIPDARVGERDVIMTFAGARPLLAFAGEAGAASREHRIEEDCAGLVSVLGGKYTTYRRMAQQAVDVIVKRYRLPAASCRTDRSSLIGAMTDSQREQWQAAASSLDPEALGRLLARYGTSASGVLQLLSEDRSLAEPVCPHHPYLKAELVHALQHELACTVTDLLFRRTRMAYSPCHGLDALEAITGLFARYAGLPPERIERQIVEYRLALEAGLAWRR